MIDDGWIDRKMIHRWWMDGKMDDGWIDRWKMLDIDVR